MEEIVLGPNEVNYSEESVRAWLSARNGRTFTESRNKEEFDWLFELLKRHPSYNDWVKKIATGFKITRSKGNKAIQLNVSFSQGEKTKKYRIVSWVACANQKLKKRQLPGSTDDQLTSAMRYAIRRQIAIYKNEHPLQQCEICISEKRNHSGRVEVDHFPKRFVMLRDDFIQQQNEKGRPNPTHFDWHPKHGISMFDKNSSQWKKAWQDYHRKHASYRYLCPTCNKTSTRK